MFFNRHPHCRCELDPCCCPNLPPLDDDGRPQTTYGALGPDYPRPRTDDRKDGDA